MLFDITVQLIFQRAAVAKAGQTSRQLCSPAFSFASELVIVQPKGKSMELTDSCTKWLLIFCRVSCLTCASPSNLLYTLKREAAE